ncbi:hypothetical protein VP01_905g1 [Puccinia sorghi]|uniref:Uncharacterized protein n=1 Tax=Puccinia sorghi TaxID=27349 RepID=A0A0L6U7P9_9BASI|nr:hypothetical protein VP01_905g1 [Puccinia sorghi]
MSNPGKLELDVWGYQCKKQGLRVAKPKNRMLWKENLVYLIPLFFLYFPHPVPLNPHQFPLPTTPPLLLPHSSGPPLRKLRTPWLLSWPGFPLQLTLVCLILLQYPFEPPKPIPHLHPHFFFTAYKSLILSPLTKAKDNPLSLQKFLKILSSVYFGPPQLPGKEAVLLFHFSFFFSPFFISFLSCFCLLIFCSNTHFSILYFFPYFNHPKIFCLKIDVFKKIESFKEKYGVKGKEAIAKIEVVETVNKQLTYYSSHFKASGEVNFLQLFKSMGEGEKQQSAVPENLTNTRPIEDSPKVPREISSQISTENILSIDRRGNSLTPTCHFGRRLLRRRYPTCKITRCGSYLRDTPEYPKACIYVIIGYPLGLTPNSYSLCSNLIYTMREEIFAAVQLEYNPNFIQLYCFCEKLFQFILFKQFDTCYDTIMALFDVRMWHSLALRWILSDLTQHT